MNTTEAKDANTPSDRDVRDQRIVSLRTYDWMDQTHEISRPDLPDEEVARRVRMMSRSDLDHEFVCTLGRDRIMALVKEKASLEEQVERLARAARFAITEMDGVLQTPSNQNDEAWMSSVMYDAANELRDAMSEIPSR